MGKTAPWKDIPDSNVFPAGVYEFQVKELLETASKATDTTVAKLMYVAQLKVVEPKEFRGNILFDRFTIGSEEDPNADDPETWKASIGARRLKQFVKALAITLGDDMDDTCEAAEGQKALAVVSLDAARKDPKTGRTYQEGNSVSAYYELGKREVGVGKPAVPPSAPAAPASPAGAKVAASAKAVPAAPKGDGAAAPAPAKPVKKDMTECPICKESVPRTGFILHVNQHENDEAGEGV